MRYVHARRPLLVLVWALVLSQSTGLLLAQDHWVATWAASAQVPNAAPARGAGPAAPAAPGPPPLPAAPAPPAAPAAPAPAAPQRGLNALNDQTMRMIVRTTIPGQQVRVEFSNAHGTSPLVIGAAHVGLRSKDSALVAGSDRELTFNGKPNVKIPVGASILSDAVALNVPKLAELAISVYAPADTGTATRHSMALRSAYVVSGNAAAQPEFSGATTSNAWFFISRVDVMARKKAAAIVALGDSITDGATSTPETNHSWPSLLAERLAAGKKTEHLAIINQGISGNRLLLDGTGTNALARFDRDVLSTPGIKYLMILEGINDIGQALRTGAPPENALTADDIIGAYKQMIQRAHSHGIKVIGCTLTPYVGAAYASDAGEKVRSAVNDWIRTSKDLDGVVDFDVATRDPQNPRQFLKKYNNTDNLHPNDAGYQAMADAIPLSIFTSK